MVGRITSAKVHVAIVSTNSVLCLGVYAKELALLYLAEIGMGRNDLTNPEV